MTLKAPISLIRANCDKSIVQVEVVNPTDISTPVVNAVQAQTATLTAQLQEICDKLDAGITVNAVQSGQWTVSIDAAQIQSIIDAIFDANEIYLSIILTSL